MDPNPQRVTPQAQTVISQRLVRSKSPERAINCHSFVAVSLQKPRPQVGVLIGHTNTEYSSQNPVYGSNLNNKVRQALERGWGSRSGVRVEWRRRATQP